MDINLSEALKRFKTQNNMSYARMSKQLGIPEQQLIRWITGKHQPRLAWQELIRARLGL